MLSRRLVRPVELLLAAERVSANDFSRPVPTEQGEFERLRSTFNDDGSGSPLSGFTGR